MRGAAQDLGRARSEQHVLRLDAVLLGDQLGDFGGGGELIAAELAEPARARRRAPPSAGPERVLVAGQDDRRGALRVQRARSPGRRDRLRGRGPPPRIRRRPRPQFERIDVATATWLNPPSPSQSLVTAAPGSPCSCEPRTFLKTPTARSISACVPMEMRQCVFS